jgi:hypothetical protein
VKTTTTSLPAASTTTTTAQNNIIALQFTGSNDPWINNAIHSTLIFKLIDSTQQWNQTATGTCSITLLGATDSTPLAGAQLVGTTAVNATGGQCYFGGLKISGTTGTSYRLRASLANSGATTLLPLFQLG